MTKSILLKEFGELKLNTENHQAWQNFVLEELNKEFKTASVEKYEDATVSFLFQESLRIYHKNHKSISDRELGRIQKYMTNKMKAKYGPYVNILRKKDWFGFNFNNIFKTDFGRIYSTSIDNLFITTHAIERFEERLGPFNNIPSFIPKIIDFQKIYHTIPTSYDLLSILISKGYEFGFPKNEKRNFYLNIGYGILVINIYQSFCLGITFLTPDMEIPASDWILTGPVKLIGEETEHEIPVDSPSFVKDWNGTNKI